MGHEYSKAMCRMKNIYRWVIPVALAYSIALSCLLSGFYFHSYQPGHGAPPVAFDVNGKQAAYSKLEMQMLSPAFATNTRNGNAYYFALDFPMDSRLRTYIVEIPGELPKELKQLVGYFYGEGESAPPTITLTGISLPIDKEIQTIAIDSFNQLWGKGKAMVSDQNFSKYFGTRYLDATKGPAYMARNLSTGLGLFAILAFIIATWILASRLSFAKVGAATLKRYGQELPKVDGQLGSITTVAYPKAGLYLTNDYIISNVAGFNLIPYREVEHVCQENGWRGEGMVKRLVVETKDHKRHALIHVRSLRREKLEDFLDMARQVTIRINQKREGLERMEGIWKESWQGQERKR